MITIKSTEEIKSMQVGGNILKRVLAETISLVRPGITTAELDKATETRIEKYGGMPGFKRVKGYSYATCICVNEQVVHTEPSDRVLKNGDVVTIDAGVYYNGLHTDSADTVIVGKPRDDKLIKFLQTGKHAVEEAIKEAKVDNHIGHISAKLEEIITKNGYFIIKELTGHGVGRELHEDPLIPAYLDRDIAKTPKISEGMTLAIEVIYSMGTSHIVSEKGEKWSLKTKDDSIGACFEDTIAITKESTLILT